MGFQRVMGQAEDNKIKSANIADIGMDWGLVSEHKSGHRWVNFGLGDWIVECTVISTGPPSAVQSPAIHDLDEEGVQHVRLPLMKRWVVVCAMEGKSQPAGWMEDGI